MICYYILDDNHTPVRADAVQWLKAYEKSWRVDFTDLGEVCVSTVFLGVDHNFLSGGPPLLFETMIFGGDLDLDQRRYSTWAEAKAGHIAMVSRARRAGLKIVAGGR